MYSPHIRDDLIPRVYRIAKATRVRMTTWVNRVIEQALAAEEQMNTNQEGGRKP